MKIDPSTKRIQETPLTPEQQRRKLEEVIASTLSLTLGVFNAGPLLWNVLIVWGITLALGGVVWFGMYKVFCGPLQIVSVFGRIIFKTVMCTIEIGTATAALGFFVYIAFKIMT